jgi:hypothetical protein
MKGVSKLSVLLCTGARVRRAKGRRPPQFLDLDADVKFADVAGLGDIRKELEEIVDFFTYGEKYRRRGSKIPGMSSSKFQSPVNTVLT